MINFLEETMEALKENGKSFDDVEFIAVEGCIIKKEYFIKYANFIYDDGYGMAVIPYDFVIVGKDWWLERYEYDGSECWEFKTMPNFDDYNDEYLNDYMAKEWFDNIKNRGVL